MSISAESFTGLGVDTACKSTASCALLVFYVEWIGSYDVSELIGPIFKGQANKHCLTLEDGTNKLPRNTGNELPTCAE